MQAERAEQLDHMQTLPTCCRVNATPRIEGQRVLLAKKPGKKKKKKGRLLQGINPTQRRNMERRWMKCLKNVSANMFYVCASDQLDELLADWRIDQLPVVFAAKASTVGRSGNSLFLALRLRISHDIQTLSGGSGKTGRQRTQPIALTKSLSSYSPDVPFWNYSPLNQHLIHSVWSVRDVRLSRIRGPKSHHLYYSDMSENHWSSFSAECYHI